MQRKSLAVISVAASVLVLLGGLMLFGVPHTGPGIGWSVFATDLEKVSALAFNSHGELFATLEKGGGKGELVRLGGTGSEVVLRGLNKPDGLLFLGDSLYITNENGRYGLTRFDGQVTTQYDSVAQAEGIAASADGSLLLIEDRKRDGRLLQFDPVNGTAKVLLSNLVDAEGVCESPDGAVWFVEKDSPNLSRIEHGEVLRMVDGLVKPAFLNCLDDGSILITEDRTNFGRLLRYRDGRLEVLARNLRAPQVAVFGADGALFLAEQNRNRVLRFEGI
ncbi:MAG: hypothetical protein KDI82_10620 [Gammaproteobacteria bacterium]|nr:hypothetical protein [Gammaproteobacteria bacterium]